MGKTFIFLLIVSSGWEAQAFGGLSTRGYSKEKDDEGHTVYKKSRLVPKSSGSSDQNDNGSDADDYYDRRYNYSYDREYDQPQRRSDAEELLLAINTIGALGEMVGFGGGRTQWVEVDEYGFTERHWALSMGMLGGRGTGHFDLSVDWLNKYVDLTLGVTSFNSDRNYGGFIGGVRAHMPWKISPFIGVGFFTGDSEKCNTQPYNEEYDEEICEMYILRSMTYEAGVQARFYGHFQARAYARHLENARQGDSSSTLYGVSLMWLF